MIKVKRKLSLTINLILRIIETMWIFFICSMPLIPCMEFIPKWKFIRTKGLGVSDEK